MNRSFKRCNICGKFDWTYTHRCDPKWVAQIIESDEEELHEDNYSIIYAKDEEEAAINYIKEWDSYDSDYSIANGSSVKVKVCKESSFVTLLETKDMLSSNEEALLLSDLDEEEKLDLINQNKEFDIDIKSLLEEIKIFTVAGEWSVDYYIDKD